MNNFKYFLREIEFRVILKKQNNNEKLNTFFELTKKVYDICQFKFSSKEELESYIFKYFIISK